MSAITGAGFIVKVPQDVRGGFVKSSGELYFVSVVSTGGITPGSAVTLYSRGLVTSIPVGEALISKCDTDLLAPISALLPIDMAEANVPVHACVLHPKGDVSSESGGATINYDNPSVWKWLYDTTTALTGTE